MIRVTFCVSDSFSAFAASNRFFSMVSCWMRFHAASRAVSESVSSWRAYQTPICVSIFLICWPRSRSSVLRFSSAPTIFWVRRVPPLYQIGREHSP